MRSSWRGLRCPYDSGRTHGSGPPNSVPERGGLCGHRHTRAVRHNRSTTLETGRGQKGAPGGSEHVGGQTIYTPSCRNFRLLSSSDVFVSSVRVETQNTCKIGGNVTDTVVSAGRWVVPSSDVSFTPCEPRREGGKKD